MYRDTQLTVMCTTIWSNQFYIFKLSISKITVEIEKYLHENFSSKTIEIILQNHHNE